MQPFAYMQANKLDQAIAAGAKPETAFLAGGTDLLNWLRLGIATPNRILDITRIKGLERIEMLSRGGLRIGPLVRLNDAAQHEPIVRDYPVLRQAILKAASPQMRNLATMGGNPLQKTRCAYFRAEECSVSQMSLQSETKLKPHGKKVSWRTSRKSCPNSAVPCGLTSVGLGSSHHI